MKQCSMGIKINFFFCKIIVTGHVFFRNLSVVVNLFKMTYGNVVSFRTLITFNHTENAPLKKRKTTLHIFQYIFVFYVRDYFAIYGFY